MAVPKRRQSNARTGSRRAHHSKHRSNSPTVNSAAPPANAYGLPEVRPLHGPKSRRDRILSRIAFLFPGQGAKRWGWAGAGRVAPAARWLFDRAADVLDYDLAKLCFQGPAEDLEFDCLQPAGDFRHQFGGV